MQDGWISINDYARKFNVSDITVRRRIRQGKIPAELKNGKYYIRADGQDTRPAAEQHDTPPPGVVSTTRPSFSLPPPPASVSHTATAPPTVVATEIPVQTAPSPTQQSKELLEFCDRYLDELKTREQHLAKRHESEIALLEAKLAKKDSEITALKQQIEDLQLLVKILENKI